ncbi:hypothetical protein V7S43_002570 [Phytophthora oleae]|uniref:WD repeat and coiled-coil-containing protein n=1 Tax=Phytophthora oleae TaxID=2107226 RepID=A0ABD3FYS5_9STRA
MFSGSFVPEKLSRKRSTPPARIFYESKYPIIHWKCRFRMLINGPTEWGEALLTTGVKGNLLQDGYSPKLQMSAMSLGPTVVITQYADTDTTSGFGRGVMNQPADSLVLHENTDKHYRLTAWAVGSAEKSLLAIASTTQVEIWEVTATSSISAALRGSVNVDRPEGLAWNPRNDILLAYSKTNILLINASQPSLSWRVIHADNSKRHAWNACSWSPCGLQVSLAQKHFLHCFGWKNVESVHSEPPHHVQFDATSSSKGINGQRMNIGTASVGPIAAIARVSPAICILTTDSQIVLEDISRAAPALNSMPRNTISVERPSTSNHLLHPETPYRPKTQEQTATSSSDIIDLTSIRISTNSTQNLLQILNRAEDITCSSTHQHPPKVKPRTHLLIAERKEGQWGVTSIHDLPHLTSPDIIVVQGMRVIVGSTLSLRLLVAHLDVSDRQEWTAVISGELELPPMHVCRGIYLAERSPFVDIASTEKRKRTTFFHAAANDKPQPIYLSKFKVSRRARVKSSPKPVDVHQEVPTNSADKTSRSSNEVNVESKDLMELILTKMTAMQTQLNARFDVVDQKLQQLTKRVELMEYNNGTSPK